MKFLFLSLLFLTLPSFAKWTTDPLESGTVWNFDRNCVDLKLKDGSILRVQKQVFGSRRLEARKTVVEFHKDALNQDLCK